MKTYLRLLSFAKPIEKYAIPYVFCSIFSVVFNTLNLTLLAPLLNTLINEDNPAKELKALPSFELSAEYFTRLFNYYIGLYERLHGKFGALEFVCGVLVLSVFLSNFFRYFAQRIIEDLRVHILLGIREKVFKNVLSLHIGYFSNERKGDVLSKISSDVTVVQFTITNTLQVIFKEPLQLAAYLIVLFSISARLTLISLLVVPLSGLLIAAISKRLRRQAQSAQNSYGALVSIIEETLSGMKIITSFGAQRFINKRFSEENHRFTKTSRSITRRQQLASPLSEFLGVSTVAGIVLYGGYLILNKHTSMTAGQFIAYIIMYSQVINPIKTISTAFGNIHQGLAAGDRVLQLIDEQPQITNIQDPTTLHSFERSVEFKDVSFSYGRENVLNRVNFEILKGETVALVGSSGSGKSTLSDLLCRFFDVSEGRILIDGHDIRSIDMGSLRSLMGVVSQETILFNDTIYDNIAFGRDQVSKEDVEHAAKIANANEFIVRTEQGYQTNIGDRGVKLSGGQKQRLSIARAILKNPPILILDEATSALDTESEKLVQEALNNLMKNRTSLVIAHRLSTIQQADKIIVLEAGQIVECGTHQSLTAQKGIYHRLSNMQASS